VGDKDKSWALSMKNIIGTFVGI